MKRLFLLVDALIYLTVIAFFALLALRSSISWRY